MPAVSGSGTGSGGEPAGGAKAPAKPSAKIKAVKGAAKTQPRGATRPGVRPTGISATALSGTRIRERRLAAQIKQADLARAVGVSAAYLNLIEKNRRVPRPALLAALAVALGVTPEALEEGREDAVFDSLREAADGAGQAAAAQSGAAPDLSLSDAPAPEVDRIEAFVSRFPGWAGLLAARHRRVDVLEGALVALSQRMAHDPYLSETLHQVLSAVTSLRSTAAILAEDDDIAPDWRARFHRTLADDSRRAAETAEALAAYLDRLDNAGDGLSSPQDEVEAWLAAQDWAPTAAPAPEEAALISASGQVMAAAQWGRLQADAARLPDAPLMAALAEMTMGQGAAAVDEGGQGGGGEPSQGAEQAPQRNQPVGLDPFALAQRLDRPVDLVMRRLAALPPTTPGLPPGGLGLAICDAAGALLFRRPLAGFTFPRGGGAACALWPLFSALSSPGQPSRDRIEMAGRWPARFVTFAWAGVDLPQGTAGPRLVRATMLILPDDRAETTAPLPVGPACRICPRPDCPARRDLSVIAPPPSLA